MEVSLKEESGEPESSLRDSFPAQDFPVKRMPKFTEAENELLVNMYIENRDQYHSRFGGFSNSSDTQQEFFSREWATMLTNISGIFRTSAHVKQRINDMKKYANSYLNRTNKTGGRNIFHKPYVKKLATVIAEEASRIPLHELLNEESAADMSLDDASISSHHIETPQLLVPKMEPVELPMAVPPEPIEEPREKRRKVDRTEGDRKISVIDAELALLEQRRLFAAERHRKEMELLHEQILTERARREEILSRTK